MNDERDNRAAGADERGLDEAVRAAFARGPTAHAPAGFVDRVLQARAREAAAPIADLPAVDRPRRPRSRRGWISVTAVLAAAACLALVSWRLLGRRAIVPDAFPPVASIRQEVALAGRGVAVMEPGSELRASGGGQGRWRQSRGAIFYRVERGGRFFIETPAGEVTVRGTCFRVEVQSMKLERQGKLGFVAGAALSAAVVITVYEGRVGIANGRGTLELTAGQTGRLASDAPPQLAGGDDEGAGARAVGTPAARLPRLAAVEPGATEELTDLRERIVQQDQELTKLKGELGPKAAAPSGPYVDPSRDELLARAQRCEVRYDTPQVLEGTPHTISPRAARDMGLSDTERDAMNEVLKETHATVQTQLRKLYVEIGGDRNTAERLSSQSLINEIGEKLPESAGHEARVRLSQERAGLLAPPANLAQASPAEQVLRLLTSVGDDLERQLGERIGADRAHALRLQKDGWSGGRSSMSGCK